MSPRPARRPSNDRWMVSYADFVTLLFALFVVMYAVARSEAHKEVQVAASIDAAFRSLGLFPSAANVPVDGKNQDKANEQAAMPMNIVMGEEVMAPAEVKQNLDHLKREMTQTLSNQVASHTVSIHMGRDGLVISLREAGFFSPGSATPKPETVAALAKVAETLGRTQYDLRIEGHTDNVPIHTSEFASNWELSAARATHIARMLLAMHTIPAEKISAAGYAEFHPVAGNDTPEGRAQNRRVDIVVLPRSSVDFTAASKALPQGSDGAWHKISDEQ